MSNFVVSVGVNVRAFRVNNILRAKIQVILLSVVTVVQRHINLTLITFIISVPVFWICNKKN